MLTARVFVETIAALGTVSSLGFYLLSAGGIASFLRARKHKDVSPRGDLPPVSILKPLKGIDPHIWESFCSHCEQEYGEFQIIFGVSDPEDPAMAVVRKLQDKYPQCQIELLVCPRELGANRKLSTLAQMLPSARHEILVVNDSDILVPGDYLQRVIAPLGDEQTGMVTCLYRGVAAATLGSRLEALSIATDFVPGVLSARLMENGLKFGLGSTLAFRKTDLHEAGGFEALVDYLADDYELGRRIAGLGRRVELSEAVVETYLPPYSIRQFVEHQLRWSRTIRSARPSGYLGLIFTFGLPWALLTVVASRDALWAWILFVLTLTFRFLVGFRSALDVLGDRQIIKYAFLLPLRDLITPVLWLGALFGSRIVWRGDVFHLKKGLLTRGKNDGIAEEKIPPQSVP
jgi:ceramide glucosyltransferase